MHYRGLVAIGLLLAAGQVTASETTTVGNLLERMTHAINNLDYQGVFVYQRGNRLETIRIIHRATPDGERARLVSMNGKPREILRANSIVAFSGTNDRSIVVDRRLTESLFPALPPSQRGNVEQYYDLEMLGTGRIAGLEAVVIGIQPKDKFRFGHRLWLEEDTGMLLKSELLNTNGDVLERLMFTTISLGGNVPISALQSAFIKPELRFGPLPPPDFDPNPLPEGGFDWRAAGLPPGFRLKIHKWERLAEDAPPAEHLIYTDGLASVSVYVEEAAQVSSPAPAGAARMGAISAFIRKLDEHRITVVGEVPAVTVRTIAAGMHRRGAAVAADD